MKAKVFLGIGSVAFLLVVGGCKTPTRRTGSPGTSPDVVSSAKVPEWVNGSSREYPAGLYLTGVGSGPTRNTAEENARAALARIFVAEVESRTQTYERYLQFSSGKKVTSEEQITYQNVTRISTRMVLEGSTIAEVYRQAQPERFHALAVLDREKTCRILRDRIQGLDGEIRDLIARADGTREKLMQLRFLGQAVPKFALRDAHVAELRVASTGGQGIPGAISFSDVRARIDELLSQSVHIGIRTSGHGAEEIRGHLAKALSARGLPVLNEESRDTPDLTVEMITSFRVVPRSTEFVGSRWEARCRLLDRQGKALNTVVREGEGGYISKAQAEEMSLAEMKKDLGPAIEQLISSYLFGL